MASTIHRFIHASLGVLPRLRVVHRSRDSPFLGKCRTPCLPATSFCSAPRATPGTGDPLASVLEKQTERQVDLSGSRLSIRIEARRQTGNSFASGISFLLPFGNTDVKPRLQQQQRTLP